MICLQFSCKLAAQISINEVVSDNKESLLNEGMSPDWVEFHNSGGEAVNIKNYLLSDNAEKPDKFIFPDYVLDPGSYLIIICDGTDARDQYLHANFKISSSGENLVFSDSEAVIIEQIGVPALDQDISFGKIEGEWQFLTPTPGSKNEIEAKLPPPSINVESGIYNAGIEVTINHPDPLVELIVFTDNLDESTSVNSNEFTFTLDSTTQICVKAKKAGLAVSETICGTYIIDNAHQIPIISVMGSAKALFDPEDGLFELGPDAESSWPFWGANFWKDQDTEVFFEYFNHPTNPNFFAHSDLEMHGGRESRTQAQKTFRLLAKQKYNQDFFEFPFFDAKPSVQRFKRIVLRNASGDYGGAHCRDGFLEDYLMKSALNLDANAYEPVAVYINGEYYGLMGLREKMDKYYPVSNYQVSKVDLLEEERLVLAGDSSQFVKDYKFLLDNDLALTSNYERATQLFDTDNLIDYFHSQIGNVSTAWPQNNIKYWRGYSPNDRWRYLLFDMDIALGRHPWTLADENALVNKMTSFGRSNTFINTVYAFLENRAFYTLFMNRHQDLFNTKLHRDSMSEAFEEFTLKVDSEMQLHYLRWPEHSYENWESVEIQKVFDFMEERAFYATTHMDEFFKLGGTFQLKFETALPEGGKVSLNSIEEIRSGFEGVYFKSIPVALNIKVNPGYFFHYWEIDGGKTFNPQLLRTFSEDVSVRAVFSDKAPENFVADIKYNDGELQIALNNTLSDNIEIDIFTTNGQKLASFIESEPQRGTLLLSEPFNPLTNGIYIIFIRQGGSSYSHKLAIIK